jgi:hypothetical protein
MIVEVLQPFCDIYQLCARREPVNNSKNLQIPTKSKGFCLGWFLIKSVIFPFSIHGETIRNGFGIEVTPRNGKTFS